jgi:hypothetical protein
MTPRLSLFASIISVFLCSCAASYKPINPSKIIYPSVENGDQFSYKYNVLRLAGNKKLAKKEDKFNVRIVAIRIVNNSNRVLRHGYNFDFYSGDQKARMLEPDVVSASIKQSVPIYLLYLLLTGMRFETSSGSILIGYVIGPGITAGNMIVAGSANKRFREELIEYSIIEREIKPGETFHGLIGISDNTYLPLTIRIKGNH